MIRDALSQPASGPDDLLDRINLSVDHPPWRAIRYSFERVARTELQRVQAAAMHLRTVQTANAHPRDPLFRMYIAVHIPPWPCKKCRPYDGMIFNVTGHAIDGSGIMAPPLPQHDNCRCYYVTVTLEMARKLGLDDELFSGDRAFDPEKRLMDDRTPTDQQQSSSAAQDTKTDTSTTPKSTPADPRKKPDIDGRPQKPGPAEEPPKDPQQPDLPSGNDTPPPEERRPAAEPESPKFTVITKGISGRDVLELKTVQALDRRPGDGKGIE